MLLWFWLGSIRITFPSHYLALYWWGFLYAGFSHRNFMLPHPKMTNQWNCIGRRHDLWNLEMATSDLSDNVCLCLSVNNSVLKSFKALCLIHIMLFFKYLCFPMLSFLILPSAPNNRLDLHWCFQKCLFTVWNTISSPQCCMSSSTSLEVACASSFICH